MQPAVDIAAEVKNMNAPDADILLLHRQWMQAVVDGQDKEAFQALFAHYAPRIAGLMMRSGAGRDMAEDIAQDVMMRVWHKAGLYRADQGTVSAWIFTIARNARIDRLRRGSSRFHQDIDDIELESEAPSSEESAIESQRAEMVNAALDILPGEQREIIEMAYIEDLPQSEIARKLSLPLGTVKSRLRLAYGRLKTHLEVLK